MPLCTRLDTCVFFAQKMGNMPFVTDILVERYCLDDKDACARFRVHASGRKTPPDLYPDDQELADRIIAEPGPAAVEVTGPPQNAQSPAER